MTEKPKKQNLFDNLFNMAYQPVIVDKKPVPNVKNHFTTVFNALNNAQEHVMIKINPGVYNERFEIRKKDMKIQASEINQNSIIINQEYPNIIVDLPEESDKILLESLKLVNICEHNSRHEVINGSYQSIKKQDYLNFNVKSSINCCLYIKKGIVQLDQCKISLAAYHNRHVTIPCIVVEEQGCLIINRSQVRGGAGTIGIFSKGGRVLMKQCLLRDHGVAGILFSTKNTKKVNLTIKNSNFIKCNESIVLNGPFQSVVQNNTISQSKGAGIVLCNGNRCKIANNEIKHGDVGIQIKNSYPSIVKNTISNNKNLGMKIKSCGGLLCKPVIKFNSINENNNGGILISGPLNSSFIMSNQLNFNNIFGIKIMNRASPHIFMNKINKTLGNGVQILEGCSVFLEKNQISSSLRCNLVIQGPNNIDNFIFRNSISKARGQGIFTIFGQKFTIKDNQIVENYNGLVSFTGVQNIEQNKIAENQKNGVLLIGDNDILMVGNQIQNNKKSGLFIRDSSVGRIQDNYFSKNRTEIIIQNDDQSFNTIKEDNSFEGEYDIRIPKNYKCQLI